MNKIAFDFIKKWEGLRYTAYKCTAGVTTIGWGTTVYKNETKVKLGDKITVQQAEDELIYRIDLDEKAINELVTIALSNNELAALLSFCYNLGMKAFKDSTLLKILNTGDKIGASE